MTTQPHLRVSVIAFTSALFLSACSEQPSNPTLFESADIEQTALSMNGHWVHNAGHCNELLKTKNFFDLKINDGEVNLGDVGPAWRGRFVTSSQSEHLKERMLDYANNCATVELDLSGMEFVDLKTSNRSVHFAFDSSNLAVLDDGDFFWLKPFDSEYLQTLEIVDNMNWETDELESSDYNTD